MSRGRGPRLPWARQEFLVLPLSALETQFLLSGRASLEVPPPFAFWGAPEDAAVPSAAKTVGIWLPAGCGRPRTNPVSPLWGRSAPGPGMGWKLDLIAPSAQQPTEASLRSALLPGDAATGSSRRVVPTG